MPRVPPLLALLLLFLSVQTRLLGKNKVCTLEQPHITYGDKFSTSGGLGIVWTISVVSRDPCDASQVVLTLSDGKQMVPSFQNPFSSSAKDYTATAFFFSLAFDYRGLSWTLTGPSNSLGPFAFPRNSPSKAFAPSKYYLIADMDESDYSLNTVNSILRDLSDKADGVIHNGDFAYDIVNHKGKQGDSFFNAFGRVSTLLPYIVAPGNHENYEAGLFFNYRFQMPGADNGLGKGANYYTFVMKGVQFITINWDYVFRFAEEPDAPSAVFKWLERTLIQSKQDPSIRWRVFFSHRPFYCPFVNESCVAYYLLKPFESLLFKYSMDFVYNSHSHYYFRLKKLSHKMGLADSNAPGPQLLVSGHSGVDPDRGTFKTGLRSDYPGVMSLVSLAGNPNYAVLEAQYDFLKITLKDSLTGLVLDEFFVRK
jgi:3',5'-cyclic AMP phosphodiesterase CpdA